MNYSSWKQGVKVMSLLIGMILAFLGQTTINLGFVLQKKGVKDLQVLLNLKKPSNKVLLSSKTWLLGLFITVFGGLFNFLALSEVSVLIVQAFLGIGIALVPIFSYWLLKESITRRDLLGLGAVIIGIIILVVALQSVRMMMMNISIFKERMLGMNSLLYHLALIGFLIAAWLGLTVKARKLGVLFGILSGMAAGYAQVMTRPLAVNTLDDITLTLTDPLAWLLGLSVVTLQAASIIIMQSGFKRGNAAEVVISYNGLALLVPVTASLWLLEEWIFDSSSYLIISLFGIFLIIIGILLVGERGAIPTAP